MATGPKPITFAERDALAKEASDYVSRTATIRNYSDLKPVFDQFEDFTICFQFLLEKGIVSECQRKSVSHAFCRVRKALQGE